MALAWSITRYVPLFAALAACGMTTLHETSWTIVVTTVLVSWLLYLVLGGPKSPVAWGVLHLFGGFSMGILFAKLLPFLRDVHNVVYVILCIFFVAGGYAFARSMPSTTLEEIAANTRGGAGQNEVANSHDPPAGT